MKKYTGLALALGLAVANGVDAQTDEGGQKRGNRRVQLEEVVVTAQKREENIQDVPISLQAFSGDELDAKGISDPTDLPSLTPGLVYNSIASFSIIYLRGVGTNIFTPSAAPSVATYIDGVFFPFSQQLAQSFGKVERIEVLKGPQGTLFGRNTTGGAISVTTAKPEEELYASVNLSVGSFDERKAKFFITGPLTVSLSASLSMINNEKDDYYELAPESPLNSLPGYKDEGYQAKLRWHPSDWFDWTVSYLDTEFESPGSSVVHQVKVTPLGLATGTSNTQGDYKYSGNAVPFGSGKSEVTISTMEFNFAPFDAKIIAGFQEHANSQQIDFDGGPNNNVAFRSDEGLVGESDTIEVQFLSNGDGWFSELFDRPMTWVAGYYKSDTTQGFNPVHLEAVSSANLLGGSNVLGINFPVFLDPVFDALPDVGATIRLTGLVNFESQAAFGQFTYDVFDWMSVTVGGRYTEESVQLLKPSSSVAPTIGGVNIPILTPEEQQTEATAFTPKYTVDFTPAEDTLIYLSWQEGFKSGTYNIINIYTEPDEIKPEKITATELGLKTSFFDSAVRFNAAIFEYEIEDYQALTVSLQSGGAVSLENAAEVNIQGAEFDMTWAVTSDLIFNMGVSYLDAEFSSYPDGSGYDPASGLYLQGQNFSGNTPPQTADISGNIGLFYTMDAPGGLVEMGLDGYYNSGFFFDNQNEAEEDGYTTFGARVGYLYERYNLRLTAYGKNITDEKYFFVKFPFDFGTVGKFAPPASYGLRLDWEFL